MPPASYGSRNACSRRNLVVPVSSGEGPLHNPTCRPSPWYIPGRSFIEFKTSALARRMRTVWIEARVTKVASVSARFSKSWARRRFRPNCATPSSGRKISPKKEAAEFGAQRQGADIPADTPKEPPMRGPARNQIGPAFNSPRPRRLTHARNHWVSGDRAGFSKIPDFATSKRCPNKSNGYGR